MRLRDALALPSVILRSVIGTRHLRCTADAALGHLGRAAGAALDEGILAVMKRPSRYPGEADYTRVRDELAVARRIYGEDGRLAGPQAFFGPAPPPPEMRRRATRIGLQRFEHWSFASAYAPDPGDPACDRWRAYERNRRGHAWVLRHPGPERPWLVCLHGLGTGTPLADFPGFRVRHLHGTLGLNLMLPVLPLHGPRREAGMERGALLSFELLDNLHGVAQAVHDVRSLLAWTRSEGAPRVGIYGLSLGAYTASLVAGLDRVESVIAGIPFCDLADLFLWHSPSTVREQVDASGVMGEDLRALYAAISPLALEPRVAREDRYVFAGRADRMSTYAQARRLWRAWQRPRARWFDGGHVSFFFSRDVERFVDDALARSTLVTAA